MLIITTALVSLLFEFNIFAAVCVYYNVDSHGSHSCVDMPAKLCVVAIFLFLFFFHFRLFSRSRWLASSSLLLSLPQLYGFIVHKSTHKHFTLVRTRSNSKFSLLLLLLFAYFICWRYVCMMRLIGDPRQLQQQIPKQIIIIKIHARMKRVERSSHCL